MWIYSKRLTLLESVGGCSRPRRATAIDQNYDWSLLSVLRSLYKHVHHLNRCHCLHKVEQSNFLIDRLPVNRQDNLERFSTLKTTSTATKPSSNRSNLLSLIYKQGEDSYLMKNGAASEVPEIGLYVICTVCTYELVTVFVNQKESDIFERSIRFLLGSGESNGANVKSSIEHAPGGLRAFEWFQRGETDVSVPVGGPAATTTT